MDNTNKEKLAGALRDLRMLLSEGVITEDEFNQKKEQIINIATGQEVINTKHDEDNEDFTTASLLSDDHMYSITYKNKKRKEFRDNSYINGIKPLIERKYRT